MDLFDKIDKSNEKGNKTTKKPKKTNSNKILLIFLVSIILISAIAIGNYVRPKNRHSRMLNNWGLGKVETEYVSNDRDYTWYLGDKNKEPYLTENYSIVAAAMAAKWYDRSIDLDVRDIREEYKPEGGRLSTLEVFKILEDYNVNSEMVNGVSIDSFKKHLKDGAILLVTLNMEKVEHNRMLEERVGNFYKGYSDEMLLIKGYRIVDENLFFEIYDPNIGHHQKFKNHSYKAVDRYYDNNELMNAIEENQFIVVYPPNK